jgi:hypothetical protein
MHVAKLSRLLGYYAAEDGRIQFNRLRSHIYVASLHFFLLLMEKAF